MAQALRRHLADVTDLAKLVLGPLVLSCILPQVLALPWILRLVVFLNWIVYEATALIARSRLALSEETSVPFELLFSLHIVVPQILKRRHREVQVRFKVLAMVSQLHILLFGVRKLFLIVLDLFGL